MGEPPKDPDAHDIDALVREGHAITDYEAERLWEIVRKLHRSPTPLVLAAVRGLDRSDPRTMVFVSDVVAQLKYEAHAPLRDETLAWLREAVGRSDPNVVSAAAVALYHRAAEEHESVFIGLSGHASADVREAASLGLGALESLEAAEALAKLCLDTSRDVRSWATFGLTSNLRTSDAIERALWQCTTDDDGEVRGEAILALTARQLDTREAITREVNSEELSGPLLDAVLLAPRSEWCAPLGAWRSGSSERWSPLNEAIAACCWPAEEQRSESTPPERSLVARIELPSLVNWWGLHTIAGTEHQTARVLVDGSTVCVALPLRPRDLAGLSPERKVRELENADAARLVVVTSDGAGHATGVMPAGGDREHAAVAIATVLAAWGWDESPTFDVRIDDVAFTVSLAFDPREQAWTGRAAQRQR